jgi:hypothetical protein
MVATGTNFTVPATYIAFALSIEGAFSRPEDQIFCLLHLHKRVIEKVITLIFTRSVDELNSDLKKKRVAHIELLQSHVNTLAPGPVEKPGHWKCPVKTDKRSATAASLMTKRNRRRNNYLT